GRRDRQLRHRLPRPRRRRRARRTPGDRVRAAADPHRHCRRNTMTDYDALVVGGGQSGLAAAYALSARGLRTGLLEAGDEPVGAWPHYYDSLTLFSPAKHSALPGL